MEFLSAWISHIETGVFFEWRPKTRTITYDPRRIGTPVGQFVLLHEIGHAVLGHRYDRTQTAYYRNEAAAWALALQVAERIDKAEVAALRHHAKSRLARDARYRRDRFRTKPGPKPSGGDVSSEVLKSLVGVHESEELTDVQLARISRALVAVIESDERLKAKLRDAVRAAQSSTEDNNRVA